MAEGAKMMSIYDDSAFEIETILPSNWLAWLKPGYPMTITVDEIGGSYQARVSRIAGVVDPVSQSVKIIALIRNAPRRPWRRAPDARHGRHRLRRAAACDSVHLPALFVRR